MKDPENWFRGDVFALAGEKYVFQGQTNGKFIGCKLAEVDSTPGIVDEFEFTREAMQAAVRLCKFVVSGVYANPNQLDITFAWLPPDSTVNVILSEAYSTCVRENGFETTHEDGKPTTWENNDDIEFLSIMATLPGKPVTHVVWSNCPWTK